MALLALPPVPESCGEDSSEVVFCGLCLRQRRLEAAGREFFARHEKKSSSTRRRSSALQSGAEDGGESSSDSEEEGDYSAQWRRKRRGKAAGGSSGAVGANDRLKKLLEGPKLYDVLGVKDSASVDEIRRAYRKLVLIHHPDKSKSLGSTPPTPLPPPSPPPGTSPAPSSEGGGEEEGHSSFLLIQDAYEVLVDPSSRQQYDSALPFDDDIPEEDDIGRLATDGNLAHTEDNWKLFSEAFRDVFDRNARWSRRKPVPDLGARSTPLSKVKKFYDFWYNFDSWRDFSIHDEFFLAEAECREERRWMERQNARIRKKYVIAEAARIRRLTELAQSRDPRILTEEAAAKARKVEAKAAKRREIELRAEEKRQEEERKRKEAEEAEQKRKLKEEADTQKRREEKQQIRKLRQRLRQLTKGCGLDSAGEAGLQVYCLAASHAALEVACTEIEAVVSAENGRTEGSVSHEVRETLRRHITILEKERQEEEARRKQKLEAAQAERQKQVEVRKVNEKNNWTREELSTLAKGLQKFPGGTARRWNLISDFIKTKSPEEVVEKTKEMADGQSLKSMGTSLNRDAFEHFTEENKKAMKKIDVEPDVDFANDSKEKKGGGLSNSSWTSEQQTALEMALAKYPASMPAKERWAAIASAVDGRSARECLARFKEIRQAVLASRNSPQS